MLKLVSGQHTKAPGVALRGPPGIAVSAGSDTNLALLDLAAVRSPTPAAHQQLLQQLQGRKAATSATPRTPQNLLAMVQLLDQQLHHLEEQYDNTQPEQSSQDKAQPEQGRKQHGHSLEPPAVLPPAQAHADRTSSGGMQVDEAVAGCAGPALPGSAGLHKGPPLAAQHQATGLSAAHQHLQPQQHTVEAPSMPSNGPAAAQRAGSAGSTPGQQQQDSNTDAGLRAGSSTHATVPRSHQDPSCGLKAADLARQHSRGLMAAGAYVLQPRKPGGSLKRRSSSPENQHQSQPQDVLASCKLPPASTAATGALQHQAPLLKDMDPAAMDAAAAARAAAEAAAAAAVAAASAATAKDLLKPDQNIALMQQREMLQQQQQQLMKLQKEQQERQQQRARPPHVPPQRPQAKPRVPPLQQQQQCQPRRPRLQTPLDTAVSMEVDDSASGALDLLSDAAIAAAAAEEMYPGVPSPLRLSLMDAQATAARSRAHKSRPVAAHKPPANRHALNAGDAAAAAAATTIPAAAAAAIAAAAATACQVSVMDQGRGHDTHSSGPGEHGGSSMLAKRPRASSDPGGYWPAALAAAETADGSAAAGTAARVDAAQDADREVKRAIKATLRAADAGQCDSGTAQSDSLQQQHVVGSASSEDAAAAAGASAAEAAAEAEAAEAICGLVPMALDGNIPADGSTSALEGPAMPAAIKAAVAELAAMAAAAARPAPQAAAAPTPAASAALAAAGAQPAQLPPRLPVAFLVGNPNLPGSSAYLINLQGHYAQALQQQQQAAAAAAAAATRAAVAAAAAAAAAARVRGGHTAVSASSLAAAGAGTVMHNGTSLAATAVQQAVGLPATAPDAAASAAAAAAANAAAHDLVQLAAAAAAAGDCTHTAAMAASTGLQAGSIHAQAEGRRQRKSAMAAAAFIAAAVAATDDGPNPLSDDGSTKHSSRPHHRHHERQQPMADPTYDPSDNAAGIPASVAAIGLQQAAAAAAVAAATAAAAAAADPAAAAAASSAVHPRGRASNGTGRGRGGSSSGSLMYDADYDTDGVDGGLYEGEDEGQDSDDERRPQSKHRTTKERVLSNRLAASRSYQRRKEEMLRLEANHAKMQVRPP